MESTFEDRGGPAFGGTSGKHMASSGKYHGSSSGKFEGNGVKPAYKSSRPSGAKTDKKPYYAAKGSQHSVGFRQKGSYTSGKKKGEPFYIDESGAVFDAFYNHIPTEKVPHFQKGNGWTPQGLISFGSKMPYGSYSDNIYNNAYDEFAATGSLGTGGYYKGGGIDLNPYKEMLEEMNKLRRENLELGKKALDEEAGSYYRQAYIRYAKDMNSLPERIFNSGAAGGLAESTAAYINAAYKNTLSEIEKEKLKNIGALQSSYAESRAKDQASAMDKMMRRIENDRSERRTYERMLEERRYREQKEERDFRRKLIEKYYGL